VRVFIKNGLVYLAVDDYKKPEAVGYVRRYRANRREFWAITAPAAITVALIAPFLIDVWQMLLLLLMFVWLLLSTWAWLFYNRRVVITQAGEEVILREIRGLPQPVKAFADYLRSDPRLRITDVICLSQLAEMGIELGERDY